MKNLYAICITLILMLNLSFAKDFWEKVNVPNDNYIMDISFMSNGHILTTGYGIYKTTDTGNSWNDISKFIFQGKEISLSAVPVIINSIIPVNDTLYFASFYDGYIIRSTNSGLSWTPMDSKIQNAKSFVKAENNRIFANRSNRLFYTDDLGLTWLQYQGWPLEESGDRNDTRMAISPEGKIFVSNKGVWVIDPVTLVGTKYITGIDSTYIRCFAFSNGKVYAGTDTSGIFVSTDNGQSWTNLPGSPNDVPISVMTVTQSGKIFAGSVGKRYADQSLKSGLFFSTDDGENWQQNTDTDFSNKSIYDIEYYNDVLYLTSTGIYFSEDDGMNWQSIQPTPGYPFVRLIDSYNDNNNFRILTFNNQYKSENSQNNWIKIDSELNLNNLFDICLTNEGKFITRTYSNEFLISDVEGKTFSAITIDFESRYIRDIKKDRNGFIYILNVDSSFKYQIYYSKDNGYKWEPIDIEKYTNFYILGSGNELLIIDNYMKLLFTNDFGINWKTKICPLLITIDYSDISCADISGDYIFIGTVKKGIIKSSDRGNTWSYMNDGLNSEMKISDNTNIQDVKIIDDMVYVATDFGLFSSKLNSSTWILEESGITLSNSMFIKLLNDNHIYASTTTGVYRSVDAVTSVEDKSSITSADYLDISPNPATDFITITFSDKELQLFASGYKVQILDILGIEIMSESIHPMTGSHRMNVEKLRAGVYFIRIGDNTKKFIKINN